MLKALGQDEDYKEIYDVLNEKVLNHFVSDCVKTIFESKVTGKDNIVKRTLYIVFYKDGTYFLTEDDTIFGAITDNTTFGNVRKCIEYSIREKLMSHEMSVFIENISFLANCSYSKTGNNTCHCKHVVNVTITLK